MSHSPEIAAEIQKLEPSSVIELFEIDTTRLGGGIFRFHNGTNGLNQNIVWQGVEYLRFPIQATGFEVSGQGQFPRPIVSVSNFMSSITTILLQYDDLLNSKFTRKRTLLKYLDAVNFPGGVNPTADPDVFISDDVYYVDRKVIEDQDQVQFELTSAADLQGIKVPKRVVVQSTCTWVYRSAECSYSGPPLWDDQDNLLPLPTSPEALNMRAKNDLYILSLQQVVTAMAAVEEKRVIWDAASVYSKEVRFNRGPGIKYYIFDAPYLFEAVWNDQPVSFGAVPLPGQPYPPGFGPYGKGAQREDGPSSGQAVYYFEIFRYYRDETAYNAALVQLQTAQAALEVAEANRDAAHAVLDAAVAAIPPNDPVWLQDRCGKRITSCRLRFGQTAPLPYGGFPGISR